METIEQLKKRIAELEEEVKKYKKLLADKTHQFDSVRQRYHLLNRLQAKYDNKHKLHLSEMQCLELVEQNEKLQEENAKLQEQLRNAIVPKFKMGQKVWFIVDKRNFFQDGEYQPIQRVESGSIKNFRIFAKGSKMQVHYRIKDSNCGWAETHSYREKELFTDEAEAQKYLEEHK